MSGFLGRAPCHLSAVLSHTTEGDKLRETQRRSLDSLLDNKQPLTAPGVVITFVFLFLWEIESGADEAQVSELLAGILGTSWPSERVKVPETKCENWASSQ